MTRQSTGFTLIEIMIVVSILGILALVLLPTFSSCQDEQKLLGAASELTTALRFASSEARKTKIPLRLEITPATESYQLKINTTGALLYHPLDKKRFTNSFASSSPYSGVNIATVNGNSGLNSLLFNTRGTVAADTSIALEYAGQSRTITISSVTGRISVQ